jgi:hypothetical protein
MKHASKLAPITGEQDNYTVEMRICLRVIFVAGCLGSIGCVAQDTSNVAEELARLSCELRETRSELTDSRQQIEALRQGLEALRTQVQGNPPAEAAAASGEPTVASADQDIGFLAAKVGELHQDKVESASKFPVRVSGLVLFNAYRNSGTLDIQDLPNLAFPISPGFPDGSVGGTLRQTLLGVDAVGPRLFGARTSASLTVDFAGGSPTTSYGVVSGLMRLRTAQVTLDWEKTSIRVGQDTPFFSPLSPTSYASMLEPAMAWSGNLWVWTPEIEVEHRIHLKPDSFLVLQGGILDPFTEETPPFQGRVPTAGENTRVPAVAGRVALDRSSAAHHPFSVGFGGYHARQRYQTFSEIDSWTVNADLQVPLGKRLEVSGEWYEGQAVGGLGGGIWMSVVYPDRSFPHSAMHPLRSAGGWVQLKVKPATHFELNGAFGQDENFGKNLRFFSTPYSGEGFIALQKNRTSLLNVIYSPNSVLLFAVEYRHLFTAPTLGGAASGDHLNLAAGVRF